MPLAGVSHAAFTAAHHTTRASAGWDALDFFALEPGLVSWPVRTRVTAPRPGPPGATTSPESGTAVCDRVQKGVKRKTLDRVGIFYFESICSGVVSGHTIRKQIGVWHLNSEKQWSCESRALHSARNFDSRRGNFRAEKIFPQIVMNSFSTDFKRRAVTTTAIKFALAILCALAIVIVIGLRAYSAHKDKVAANYAKRVPVAVQRLQITGVENAGKISDFLYRGAQPRGQGYEELKKLGISIVVDLRNSKPVESDGGETREQVKVEAAGMRYVEIPTSAIFGPSQSQVAEFLQLLRDNEKQRVFVHCYFGDDRTGVMVATYRIAVDHWTSDEAYNEMRAYHFHKDLILMGHFVKVFPGIFDLSPVFATLRQETEAAFVAPLQDWLRASAILPYSGYSAVPSARGDQAFPIAPRFSRLQGEKSLFPGF